MTAPSTTFTTMFAAGIFGMSGCAPDPKRDEKPAELRKRLSPLQYEVTQCSGTEPAFNNDYWNNKEPGIYVDIVSSEPLFASVHKFDSGTGWPSFTRPLVPGAVVERKDTSHGTLRTEVRSAGADSHLGHVFGDGPAPGGRRYCINSAALRFIPAPDLEKAGYARFRPLFDGENSTTAAAQTEEYATFAAGCFWGVQAAFDALDGVMETTAGYTGGHTTNPTYEEVCSSRTGHAEAVQVKYDPGQISYEQLLDTFWRIHNPASAHPPQGQYRSGIFYHSQEQRDTADKAKADLDRSGTLKGTAATVIQPAVAFFAAEDYHQKYFEKRGGAACRQQCGS